MTTSFGIVIGCNLRCNRKFRKTCLLKVEFCSLFRNLEVQALAANKTKLCTFYTNSKVLREAQFDCTTAFLEQPSETKDFAAPSGHGPNNDPDQRKSTNVCFSATNHVGQPVETYNLFFFFPLGPAITHTYPIAVAPRNQDERVKSVCIPQLTSIDILHLVHCIYNMLVQSVESWVACKWRL